LPYLKGIAHPNIKILSLFIHPQVVLNLYEFLCSVEHKRYFEMNSKWENQHMVPSFIICHRFRTTTWGWV